MRKLQDCFVMLLMISLNVPSFASLVLLQKYLSQTYAYQTDKSKIPFFYQNLSVLISKITQIIVKLKVLSDCNAAINLKRID